MKARPKIDLDSGALATIECEHSMIHSGNMWVTSGIIANTTSSNYVIDLRAATKEIHMDISCSSDSSTRLTLLRNPTAFTSSAGTAITAVNRNELFTNTAQALFYYNVTGLTTGTAVMINEYIPAGTRIVVGGAVSALHEWVLKPANLYLVSVVAALSNTCITNFDWYEIA